LVDPFPTLKRGANKRCAYGALKAARANLVEKMYLGDCPVKEEIEID